MKKKIEVWKVLEVLPYAPWDTLNLRPSLWVFESKKGELKDVCLQGYWDDKYGFKSKEGVANGHSS